METQLKYVEDCIKNKNIDLYGIFDSSSHIGNILIDLQIDCITELKLHTLLVRENTGVRGLQQRLLRT